MVRAQPCTVTPASALAIDFLSDENTRVMQSKKPWVSFYVCNIHIYIYTYTYIYICNVFQQAWMHLSWVSEG